MVQCMEAVVEVNFFFFIKHRLQMNSVGLSNEEFFYVISQVK